MPRITKLALLAPILLASCSTVRHLEFYVSAINTQEEEIPCAILIEDHSALNENHDPILTPAKVRLSFKLRSDGAGYDTIKLGVRAVEVDSARRVVRGLREGEDSPYLEDFRFVRMNDAPRQLFILRRNKSYGG